MLQRWWRRPDGVIFMMTDPDHIKRMLTEGWVEVESPHTTAGLSPSPAVVAPDVTPEPTPDELQAHNDQARAAFSATTPKPITSKKIKSIRKSNSDERSV